MKNNGKSHYTIKFVDKTLTDISKHANLEQPEQVKQYIANKTVTNGTKRNYIAVYKRYCQYYGIQWQIPLYKQEAKIRRIPTTEKLNILIARASPRLSLKLRLSKETGLRPIEICNLKVKDIDLDRRRIYPTTAKNGAPRTLKISNSLQETLQNHINTNKLNQNDKLFRGTPANYGKNFSAMRNNTAEKLNDQSIKAIRLYDLRHYFATRLYAKTRDLLYVKQQLGHKDIETTLIYVQLLDFDEEDEWICKVATTVKDSTQLIENGFQYVMEQDGTKLFRKRK